MQENIKSALEQMIRTAEEQGTQVSLSPEWLKELIRDTIDAEQLAAEYGRNIARANKMLAEAGAATVRALDANNELEAELARREVELKSMMGPQSDVDAALAKFKAAWSLMPALSRSAVAAGYALDIGEQAVRKGDRDAQSFEKLGLQRRANVSKSLTYTGLMVADLLADLCRAADMEVSAADISEKIVSSEYAVSAPPEPR